MGLFSDKLKYFRAYRSIKTVGEAIRDMNGTIENIYLIDINQIPNFLEILNKYEILEKLTDRSKRSLVSELENKLKDDFSKYELEKEIETIYLDSSVYEKRKDDIFILVDKDFLVNMKVEIKNGYKIIFNKDIKKIELPNEVFIKIEESEKKSIYKFAGIMDKSFDPNAVSHIEQEEEEDEEEDEFRVKPKKKAEEEEEEEEEEKRKKEEEEKRKKKEEEEKRKKKEEEEERKKKEEEEKRKKKEEERKKKEEQERKKKEESNIINILIDDVDDEAQTAKFNEILESIFFSLQNSNEQREIICEEIKKKIRELKLDNELKDKDDLNIIQNITTTIEFLLEKFSQIQDQQNLGNNNIKDSTYYHNDESQSLLLSGNDESRDLLISVNRENIESNKEKKIINPFKFTQVKLFKGHNCQSPKPYLTEPDHYELNLNKDCNNLDECFKLEFKEKCEKCHNNIDVYYKFQTTPEILIIKFHKPKFNNYIKPSLIEKTIDLKNHLSESNNNNNNKYELMKVLYVLKDTQNINLYVNIPEDKKDNYIPYIIFYKKTKSL